MDGQEQLARVRALRAEGCTPKQVAAALGVAPSEAVAGGGGPRRDRPRVWGAVAYARGLGFEPHPDFEQASGALGAWEPTGVVRFGHEGQPYFVQGVRDNATRILATLERSVGAGNFQFLVAV